MVRDEPPAPASAADATANGASSAATRERGFAEVWAALPDKAILGVLLGMWVLLFHLLGNSTFGYVDTQSLLGWMATAYNAEGSEDGHGNLIPIAVLVLAWMKREELLAAIEGPWWPALVMLGGAVALHVIGFVIQQPRLSVVALFTGIYAITGLLYGRRWLAELFFPFILFAFCVPIGSLATTITFPLRMLVTQITVACGQMLDIDVVRDGTRIFNEAGTFQYDVAPACSGIRSLISLLALNTIYGFVTFRTWWKRLLMIVLAAPLAILGNVLRITIVIIAAKSFSQETGAFLEQKLGFLTFAVAIVCVLTLGRVLSDDRKAPAKPVANE